ncbi:MAG: hypothetical protein J0L84_19115, partial [Verrucomicrobia bacterium]|nr:hypothetical protein [Verrucomicrobiota bacterium]
QKALRERLPQLGRQACGAFLIESPRPLLVTHRAVGQTTVFYLQADPASDGTRYRAGVRPVPALLAAVAGLSEIATLEVQTVAPAPAPRALVTGDGVQVRWPAEAAGYRLQRSGPLGGAWADDPGIVVLEGNENLVNVSAGTEATFFRLTD